MKPFVSVVIPVFNDQDNLMVCLKHLTGQTYDPHHFEILIVDNGSNPAIEIPGRQNQSIQLIKENKPGSYAARNSGICASKGDILLFTDADCRPHSDWIEKTVSFLLSQSQPLITGGQVRVVFQGERKPSAAELYDMAMGFRQRMYVEKKGFAVTANLATWKSVFTHVGLFDSDLKSSGDVEWNKRAKSEGYKLRYHSQAIVEHPARSLGELISKARRIAGGHRDLRVHLARDGRRITRRSTPLRSAVGTLRKLLADEQFKKPTSIVKIVSIFCLIVTVRKIESIYLSIGKESKRV